MLCLKKNKNLNYLFIKIIMKLQENFNNTTLSTYKRFQQTYAERKSPIYKSYSIKPTKKEYEIKIIKNKPLILLVI